MGQSGKEIRLLFTRVDKLHLDLELNQYNNLLTEEEIDLPVLAQLSEEQLSRIGIRTMGQRVRIINAAQQAMAASRLGQNVIENVVEDQPEVAGGEKQEYVDGVEGEEDVEGLEEEGVLKVEKQKKTLKMEKKKKKTLKLHLSMKL